MKWPEIDLAKTLIEIEKEHGIKIDDERNDERESDLGNHPSKSFYSNPEPDFEATRREFDKIAKKYTA